MTVGSVILYTWFIWLPIILGLIFWLLYYVIYSVDSYIHKKMDSASYVMLEINIPRDVHKSPRAMEMVIDVLWHLGGGAMSWRHRLWQGAVLIPGSLEIISVEGSIYFFIRAHKQIAGLVKNTIYSQYPNAEVNEVDDYTKYVPDYNLHEDTWDVYGADFGLAKDTFIPIQTYVDYELDKNVGSLEENQKIDPMSPMLEFLGTLKEGEQIWIQFLVRADMFTDWRKNAAAYIKDLMKPASSEDDVTPSAKLTHGQQEQVKGIERSLGKYGFETRIRALYIAPKKHYRSSTVGFFKNNIFKPFASQYMNHIKQIGDTDEVDWKWQDITHWRTPALKRRFFNDYIHREAFYEPLLKYVNFLWYQKNPFSVFTSEELATLFHIPGRVSETANLERIEATKAQPPQNLPI
jgi:hypothetical protein